MTSLRAELDAVNQRFINAINKQDLTALSKVYASDCKLMPPGMDVQHGREGVIKAFSKWFDAGLASIALTTDEVGPMGANDFVYERCHFIFYDKDGKVFLDGKYSCIWKREDGDLVAYIDCINSNK